MDRDSNRWIDKQGINRDRSEEKEGQRQTFKTERDKGTETQLKKQTDKMTEIQTDTEPEKE
jgi:hypothetical protein